MYLGGESNPYQKFRKLLFYPLNYQGKPLQKYCFLCIPANTGWLKGVKEDFSHLLKRNISFYFDF